MKTTSSSSSSTSSSVATSSRLPAIKKAFDDFGTGTGSRSGTSSTVGLCGRKPIRNRRNTITDCVQLSSLCNSNNKITTSSTLVPFESQKLNKTNEKILSNNGSTSSTTIKLNNNNKLVAAAAARYNDVDLYKINDRLNCSVSLERLSGIIDTLVPKPKMNSDGVAAGKNEDVTSASQSSVVNKILCLYCDRSFSSQKLHSKHVERTHCSTGGRRLSTRTINISSSSVYLGCSYCNNGKITCLPSEDLPALVEHLVNMHSDKYWACKECMLRFPNEETRDRHIDSWHKNDMKLTTMKRPSSVTKIITNNKSKNVQSQREKDSHHSLTTPLTVETDFDATTESDQSSREPTLRSRLRRASIAERPSYSDRQRQELLSSEETFLSRLGIAHNRSPRSRKGAKNRRGCSSELFDLPSSRTTRSSKTTRTTNNSLNAAESAEFIPPKSLNNKTETVVSAFDEDFYESVNLNVKQNLSCYLDGKLESGPTCPSPISPASTEPAVRSVLVKSPLVTESEIHEATTISAFTAFPTLLTAQQYGIETMPGGKMKKPITKNSWKWKWDCVKKYKYVNEGGKIVKKVKQQISGMRDLSKLDMWTQLTMRSKHEVVQRQELGQENLMSVGEAAREEKRKLIEQLNKILDTRVLPQINLEQNDQSIIKLEKPDDALIKTTGQPMLAPTDSSNKLTSQYSQLPVMLNLLKCDPSVESTKRIVLSGEWARPRCYICYSCGTRFSTVRSLEEHKSSKHPFVHSTHYEIVGKELIDGDLFRNFYIPSLALQRHAGYNKKHFFSGNSSTEDSMDSITSYSASFVKSESIDMDSNSRNSKVSLSSIVTSTSSTSLTTAGASVVDDEDANIVSAALIPSKIPCTKCNRDCNGTVDLYRHMLDCSMDYAWMLAKKRQHIKYRYFGTKRRRGNRSGSSSIRRKMVRPKKEASDEASPKSKEPTTPRPRPSDGKLFTTLFSCYLLFSFSILI